MKNRTRHFVNALFEACVACSAFWFSVARFGARDCHREEKGQGRDGPEIKGIEIDPPWIPVVIP